MSLKMQTEKSLTINKKDVCYIILKNSAFCLYGDVPTYEMDICGKKIIDWVKNACAGSEIIEVEYSIQDNIFEIVKRKAKDKAVVCVLYADSPLLNQYTLNDVWNLYASSGESLCKLPRGYIMQPKMLDKMVNMLTVKRIGESFSKEFFAVNTLYAYQEAQRTMRQRIVAYFMEKGVVFRDSETVYIDADCEIEPGVIIFPNNHIYDGSKIQEGCILYPNNTIIASVVEKDCVLKGAYIEKSIIKQKREVYAFEKIINDRG